jgi:hypothetical protein
MLCRGRLPLHDAKAAPLGRQKWAVPSLRARKGITVSPTLKFPAAGHAAAHYGSLDLANTCRNRLKQP